MSVGVAVTGNDRLLVPLQGSRVKALAGRGVRQVVNFERGNER